MVMQSHIKTFYGLLVVLSCVIVGLKCVESAEVLDNLGNNPHLPEDNYANRSSETRSSSSIDDVSNLIFRHVPSVTSFAISFEDNFDTISSDNEPVEEEFIDNYYSPERSSSSSNNNNNNNSSSSSINSFTAVDSGKYITLHDLSISESSEDFLSNLNTPSTSSKDVRFGGMSPEVSGKIVRMDSEATTVKWLNAAEIPSKELSDATASLSKVSVISTNDVDPFNLSELFPIPSSLMDRTEFSLKFPTLSALSNESNVFLHFLSIKLTALNFPTSPSPSSQGPQNHCNPKRILLDFIASKRCSDRALTPKEKYSLLDLIEYLRWTIFLKSSSSLSSSTRSHHSTDNLPKISELVPFHTGSNTPHCLQSFIHEAIAKGGIFILKSIYQYIKTTFQNAGEMIVGNFLLSSLKNRLPMTIAPMSQNPAISYFLLFTLTEDHAVQDSYSSFLFNQSRTKPSECIGLPSNMERLFFPIWSRKTTQIHLQKRLLRAANPNVTPLRPLYMAIKSKNINIIDSFLQWEQEIFGGLDKNVKNQLLSAAFSTKSIKISKKILDFLNVKGVKDNDQIPIPMYLTVSSDWVEGFKMCLDLGCTVDHLDENGLTIVQVAAKFGSNRIIEYLLQFHSDFLFMKMEIGSPAPLHLALFSKQYSTISLLFKAGAKVTNSYLFLLLEWIKDEDTLLEIFHAFKAQNDSDSCVKHFALSRNSNGISALEYVILLKHLKIIKWFLTFLPINTTLRSFDSAGFAPFHLSIVSGNIELLKYFLQLDPSLKAFQTEKGLTPFQLAHRLRDDTNTPDKQDILEQIFTLLA